MLNRYIRSLGPSAALVPPALISTLALRLNSCCVLCGSLLI